MCVQEGISGYLIPVFIREIQTRRFPLNASAIDENVYLTIHQVEGLLEEIFDGVEIIEVAVHDLGGATESADGPGFAGLEKRRRQDFCKRGKRTRQPEPTL